MFSEELINKTSNESEWIVNHVSHWTRPAHCCIDHALFSPNSTLQRYNSQPKTMKTCISDWLKRLFQCCPLYIETFHVCYYKIITYINIKSFVLVINAFNWYIMRNIWYANKQKKHFLFDLMMFEQQLIIAKESWPG